MRLLLVHNAYQQPGGEDTAFAAEAQLLRDRGHQVIEYREDNRRISGMSRVRVAGETLWSWSSFVGVRRHLRSGVDLAHFHNSFPLISPSAQAACRMAGVPVVQTLYNYRLLCAAGNLYRNGAICELCVGRRVPTAGVRYACYQGSRAGSTVVTGLAMWQRLLRTWPSLVDLYVALSEFGRRKFIQGGLPAHRIVVKPNCVEVPRPAPVPRSGVLMVGRLVPEKGIRTVLEAWRAVRVGADLTVLGDGPLRDEVKVAAKAKCVVAPGHQPPAVVRAAMARTTCVIVASEWYEGLPLVIVEAFGSGTPVVASRMGAIGELVEDHATGLLFSPGDATDLSRKLEWALTHPAEMAAMGDRARDTYEARFGPAQDYRRLIAIYARAAEMRRGVAVSGT